MPKFTVDAAGTATALNYEAVPHTETRFVVDARGVATPTNFLTARFQETNV